jgi:hypothetical protein
MRKEKMKKAFFSVLFLAIPSLSTAAVDPALAGLWSLDAPGAQLVWQISTDGRYQVWGSFSDSGMIEASNGKWTTVSVSKKRQSGTYSVASTALSTVGPLGPSHWKRETGASLAGGLVPKDLPKMVQGALSVLRRTVPDAALVMIDVQNPSPVAHPIELRFYSKKANHIYVSGSTPFADLGPPNSEELPVTADFVDLPEAIATARSSGMKGAFGHAMLLTVTPPKGAPISIWQVNPAAWDGELARSVDATSGKALDTARITPMVGTDAEIMAAVHKIQGAVQAVAPQAAPAGGAAGRLASCGDNVDFELEYLDVKFPAFRIKLSFYFGDYTYFLPSRTLTGLEKVTLENSGFEFIDLNFPPNIALYRHPGPMASAKGKEQLEQMAQSGCK